MRTKAELSSLVIPPKKVNKMSAVLSTTSQFKARHVGLGEFEGIPARKIAQAQSSAPVEAVFHVKDAFPSTGLPQMPPSILLSNQLILNEGVYITTGETGSGKSVVTAALVAMANADGVPASYVSLFEPRAVPFPTNQKIDGSTIYTNPFTFLSQTASLAAKTSKAKTKLVVFDSLTLPLKAYAEKIQGQATFAEGMQITDRMFLDELGVIAKTHKMVILAVLNATLIPYVRALYGATEGHIDVKSLTVFTVADRSEDSKREHKQYEIPIPYINATLTEFGMGSYDPRLKSNRNRRDYIL